MDVWEGTWSAGTAGSELCVLLHDFTWFDKFSPMIPHISCLLLVSKLP